MADTPVVTSLEVIRGDAEIYVMNSDESSVRQLTHNKAEDFIQYWLPKPPATSPS